MQTGDHGLGLLFVKRVWEHAVPRKDHRAFHQILQLADVARPGVALERTHGFRRNRLDLLSHAAAKQLHEMRNKRGNVLPPLAERRQQDGEHVQTIIQVTAKLPASEPDIHFVRATAS
jgi:hypothetical protein